MEYDVLLLGYYGFGNIGDESILSAIITDLKENMPEIKICVLSFNPEETCKTYNVQAIDRFNLFAVRRAVKNSKMLIAGGGSLLQDVTSLKSLWYYLFIIYYALRRGIKTMLYANGIGPISRKISSVLTAKIINKVDVITLRDAESANELKRMNVNRGDISITADPAFEISPAPDNVICEILKETGITKDIRYACVAMCNKGFSENELEYIIAKVCDYFSNELNIIPLFLCMQHSVDIQLAKSIAKKMQSQACIIAKELTNSEMIGVISKADFIVGDRFHALAFAAISGVPFTGVAYDPKISSFMERLKSDNYVMLENLTFDSLKHKIDLCLSGQDIDKSKYKKSIIEMKKLSKQNARLAMALLTK